METVGIIASIVTFVAMCGGFLMGPLFVIALFDVFSRHSSNSGKALEIAMGTFYFGGILAGILWAVYFTMKWVG